MVGVGALLLVIILPVFAAAKQKAKQTQCMSNLRQIGAALRLYADDNEGLLPPWRNRRHGGLPSESECNSPEQLRDILRSRTSDSKILFCDSDLYAHEDVDVLGINHKYSSYYYNLVLPSYRGALSVDGLLRAGRVIVPTGDYMLVRDANIGKKDTYKGKPAKGCSHFGGINAVFLDWHAGWTAQEESDQ